MSVWIRHNSSWAKTGIMSFKFANVAANGKKGRIVHGYYSHHCKFCNSCLLGFEIVIMGNPLKKGENQRRSLGTLFE